MIAQKYASLLNFLIRLAFECVQLFILWNLGRILHVILWRHHAICEWHHFNTPAIDALSSNREPDSGHSSNNDLPDLSIMGTCDILVYQNVSGSHVICRKSWFNLVPIWAITCHRNTLWPDHVQNFFFKNVEKVERNHGMILGGPCAKMPIHFLKGPSRRKHGLSIK